MMEADAGEAMKAAVATLREATEWLLAHTPTNPNDGLAGATPYLKMFGLVVGGWFMERAARVGDDDRVATARFYLDQLLPQVHGLLPAVIAGVEPLARVDLSR
jgi:hypothetical protein